MTEAQATAMVEQLGKLLHETRNTNRNLLVIGVVLLLVLLFK
jgi:hypothetical protein